MRHQEVGGGDAMQLGGGGGVAQAAGGGARDVSVQKTEDPDVRYSEMTHRLASVTLLSNRRRLPVSCLLTSHQGGNSRDVRVRTWRVFMTLRVIRFETLTSLYLSLNFST